MPPAIDHFLRGANNEGDFFRGELSEFSVGQGGALLDDTQSPDDGRSPLEPPDADGKVQQAPLGFGTPKASQRYFDVTQGVGLDSDWRNGHNVILAHPVGGID